MNVKVKQFYCLVDDDGEITSTWDKAEEKGEYTVCSKKYEKGGLKLCCFFENSTEPLFEIDYVHSYKLTKHGIIIARREYTSKTSYFIKYGVISYIGRTIALMEYNKITCLQNEDYFLVQKYAGGAKGLYNYMGEELLPTKYDNFEEFSNGVIYEENGKKGIYFFESKKVVAPIYKSAIVSKAGIIVEDGLNSKYGLFSLEGEYVLLTLFDSIEDVSNGEIVLIKRSDDTYVIFNLLNKESIHSGNYEYVKVCKECGYTYCQFKLYNKDVTYLYIPDINTFVKGVALRTLKIGKIQYLPRYNAKWQDITKDMYDNADKFQNLYESEEIK